MINYSLRLMTTKEIRSLMKEGKQIQVMHMRKKNGPTFIVDSTDHKHVYGLVARCVLSNFDTELSAILEFYDINQTKGIK